MDTIRYPGEKLRDILRETGFLHLIATPNVEIGLQAAQSGSQALHLTPPTLRNAVVDAHKLVQSTQLPVLVDATKGIHHLCEMLVALEALGAAGLHMDDHIDQKRFTVEAMCARFRQALLARKHASFVLMARCSGLKADGLEATLARCKAYIAAGADMIYIDGISNEGEYRILTRALSVPLLANTAEPAHESPYTIEQLKEFGVQLVVTPHPA